MPARRRVDPAAGEQALAAWEAAQQGEELPRGALATAVRYTVEELAAAAPGRSVEVRIPPYAAAQVIEGPRHTRGTPTNVIETDPQTWLALVTGATTWAEAVASGAVRASGQRADLTAYLPLR